MCGIAGIANYEGSTDCSQVEYMSKLIAHRGPDQAGIYLSQDGPLATGLATRRLAILDLSSESNQPMSNEAGNILLAYNGELYNHLELRHELERCGYQYHSSGDTETIVHSYEEWGVDAFPRFNGMFAFALYDQRTSTLLLARDRCGIKPLYYFWNGSTFAFASELKALLNASVVRPNIDPTALWLFLCLGYVPSPYSIIAGVHKLEPGHYLKLEDGKLQIIRFASLANFRSIRQDERTTVSIIRESIEQAVKKQLMSDVPVGVFLSGGLDSTIVATLASRYHRESLHTFSVGYTDADGVGAIDSHYNEDFFVARQIAKSLGTIHHEVIVENNTALVSLFERLVAQLDEPMVEPVFMSTHYLSKLARECSVPVVLTGDGADELFGGYDRYFAAQRLAMYKKVPGLRWALPFIETMGRSSQIARSAHELKYLLDHPSAVESYIRASSIYHPDQALKLLAPELRKHVDTQALPRLVKAALGQHTSFVDQMAHADLALWVGEHFNPRLDRISMLHAVEARVPFQDNIVVEAALSVSMDHKSTRSSRKSLLKHAFADIVPELARTRPKRSYQAPGTAWLQGGLRVVYRQLLEGGCHLTGLFDPVQIRAYVSGWGKETPGQVFAVSALLITQLWARHYLLDQENGTGGV
jgi:asparagine synthase (glutamine-hydrolysing)